MITSQSAIRAIRRDLTLAYLLRGTLIISGLLCLVAGPIFGSGLPLTMLIASIVLVWIVLGIRSAKGSTLAADSPALIASGQYEEAENRIEQVLKTFSLFRAVKLMSLHHLAVLRHAQRKWEESAILSRALLRQRLGTLQPLERSSRLMLADSLMELGDLPGAYESLSSLYGQKLTLTEAISLLVVQLDYEARVSGWEEMMRNVMSKVQLAELMPAEAAAKSQALLALAAKKTGRLDWAQWLQRRAELLTDVNALVIARPMLKELWQVND